jgi:SAM-dependent methyltransferase
MKATEVKAFFERVAGDWDTMRLAYYDERVIEKMAEVSGVDATSEVADVGTGTGFVAAGIAPRVRRVVGIDNAPAMLEAARENLRALGASNVKLAAGEVERLPLEDGSVDAAFANMVLHHAEHPIAMLLEMARRDGRHHRRGGAPLRVDARGARGHLARVRSETGRAFLRRGGAVRRLWLRAARHAVMHPFYDLG